MTPAVLLSILLSLANCSSIPRAKTNRVGLAERWEQHAGYRKNETHQLSKKMETQDIHEIPKDKASLSTWIWPLDEVKINSRFGKRRRGFHEGVDLKAAVGTPVYATQSGEVIYADSKIGGYGNMIVIKHAAGVFSVYGHLSQMYVRAGEKVSQRERIGLSGKSGRVRGPHLHFEVRRGSVAMNPVNFYERSNLFTSPERKIASKKVAKVSSRKRKGT